MSKTKSRLTLVVEDALIEQMKIRALQEKRSVTDITEELYREYLKRPKAKEKK